MTVIAPWAGRGIELKNTQDIQAAIKEAKLDWDVGLKDLFTEDAEHIPEKEIYCKANGRLFGVVGPTFKPVQNIEVFNWFQPFLDSGEASLDVAGSSGDGRRIWILAKINRPDMEILPGDKVGKRVLLSNAHIQGVSVRIGYCPLRFFCSNALSRGIRASDVIRLRHHKLVLENMEKVRDIMNLADEEFQATAKEYQFLANKGVNQKDLIKYVNILTDVKEGVDISTKKKNIIDGILANYELEHPTAIGTWWGAYNTFNSYLNHVKGRNVDNRLESLWFGQSFQDNNRALKLALEMAA
jgi:phage/plasmid-like protein (TIGR03299 family)